MPVKIKNTADTSSEYGTITQSDLSKAIEEFKNHVSVTTISPKDTIIRTRSVYFHAEEVLKLLGISGNTISSLNLQYQGVRIYFTVHPDQDTCSGEEYRNHISVAVLPTKGAEKNDVTTDFVLIPGFKSFPDERDLPVCCGNIKPPPNGMVFFWISSLPRVF